MISIIIHFVVFLFIFFTVMIPIYRYLGILEESLPFKIPTYKIGVASIILGMVSALYISYLFFVGKDMELLMIGMAAFFTIVAPFIALFHERINRAAIK